MLMILILSACSTGQKWPVSNGPFYSNSQTINQNTGDNNGREAVVEI